MNKYQNLISYLLIFCVCSILVFHEEKIDDNRIEIINNKLAIAVLYCRVSDVKTGLFILAGKILDTKLSFYKHTTELAKVLLGLMKHIDPKPNINAIKLATIQIKGGKGGGAGVIYKIDKDYLYILTAKHIVNVKGEVTIAVRDKEGTLHKIEDISRDNIVEDEVLDLVKITLPKPEGDFVYLPIASKKPNIGSIVYTIGHPFSFHNTFSKGIVSNYQVRVFDKKDGDYMMITAPSAPGNSGGAVVNCYNEIIGIVTGVMYVHEKRQIHLFPHLTFTISIEGIQQLIKGDI